MAEVSAKSKFKIAYDPKEDYQAIIDQSVASGDYESAAQAEMLRNAKIAGEARSEKQTFNYYKDGANAVSSSGESYDPNTDYQAVINESVAKGDMAAAADAERKRNAKIRAEGLTYEESYKYQSGSSSPTDPYEKQKELFLKEQLEKKRKALEEKYKSVLAETAKNKNASAGKLAQSAQGFYESAAASGLNSGAMSQQKDASGRVLKDYIDTQDKSAQDKLTALKKSYDEEVAALKKK